MRRGLRLPSSRQLASDHGISRTTAVEAYERLIAEGYLYTQAGSGIFVSERIPEDFIPEGGAPASRSPRTRRRSRRSTCIDLRYYQMPLAPGMPAVDLFPWTDWNRHIAAVLRDHPICEIFHGDPFGERPLREAIVDYLGAMKGIRCDPDQIVVIGGTVQIFDHALELLRAPGSKAHPRRPGLSVRAHAHAQIWLRDRRCAHRRAGHGFREGACERAPDAHVAFVSPSHAVPTGACLSLERRRGLVEWADDNDRWIIENEFDGDFRFTSRPLPTCYSLSRNNRVLMIGSLSKPFAPGLRLGYLLLPPELLESP